MSNFERVPTANSSGKLTPDRSGCGKDGPVPIDGQTLRLGFVSDQFPAIGGVGRETCRDHRSSDNVPRQSSSREEEGIHIGEPFF